MNIRRIRLLELGFCVVFLGGCVIGNWNICGPQTPLYHCDAEAEQALLHPTPLRDRWERPATIANQRILDWSECGGNEDGRYDYPLVNGKSSLERAGELYFSIQRCMLRKGYHYTGPCDNKVTMAFPGCGAP